MLSRLLTNSRAFASSVITYAEFGTVQGLAWRTIEAQPIWVKDGILDALRQRLPTVSASMTPERR